MSTEQMIIKRQRRLIRILFGALLGLASMWAILSFPFFCPNGKLTVDHWVTTSDAGKLVSDFQKPPAATPTIYASSYLIPMNEMLALLNEEPDFIQIFNGRTVGGEHTLVFVGANVDESGSEPYSMKPVYVSVDMAGRIVSVGVDKVQPPGPLGITAVKFKGRTIRVAVRNAP